MRITRTAPAPKRPTSSNHGGGYAMFGSELEGGLHERKDNSGEAFRNRAPGAHVAATMTPVPIAAMDRHVEVLDSSPLAGRPWNGRRERRSKCSGATT